MRVLMPFWDLTIFDRYFPQMKAIAGCLETFNIAYLTGEPESEWQNWFVFEKIKFPFRNVRRNTIRWCLSIRKIYEQTRNLRVDVFYTLSGFWIQEFVRYSSKKTGIPFVIRLRGDHRQTRKTVVRNRLKRAVLNHFETESLKQADLVVPISIDLAVKAKQWNVHNTKITHPVYNGVDTKLFRSFVVPRKKKFTIAFAGRLSPEKRIPCILELAERLKNINFIIAGKNYMNIDFAHFENVEYYERLSFLDMPSFYNKADLVILPSRTEGFPCVILEAYSCQKPVLSTKEAFPQELKVFGAVTNISDFENAIKNLMRMDLGYIGEQARNYVEKNLTWEKFSIRMAEHLRKVGNRR